MTTSHPDGLHGAQRPRILNLPTSRTSAGEDAIDLAASAGLICDPWQEFVLDGALGEADDGTWSAFEIGLIVARQNGKGSIIEARELAGLYLFHEELMLHSAHEFATAQEAFLRIKFLVEQNDDLYKRVDRIRSAHGSEGIELLPTPTIITGSGAEQVSKGRAPRLRFVARTGGSGRGFSGDTVILDEAFKLPERVVAALMPTMSARPNPQVWYTSSAVDQEEHADGRVLARIRRRGMTGDDPSLAYFEWSPPEEDYDPKQPEIMATDPQAWAQANPGLGIRISAEHIEREQRSMAPKTFAVERLSIGDWPDDNGDDGPITRTQWAALLDEDSQPGEDVAFAAEVSLHREWSSIAVWSVRGDELGHSEVIDRRPGTDWLVERLVELRDRWNPIAVGVDGKGPTLSLVHDIEQGGIKRPEDPEKPKRGDLAVLSLPEMAAAYGQILDAVAQQSFRHRGQPDLDAAVLGAQPRPVGDVEVWGRKNTDTEISPITAVTVARRVFVTRIDQVRKPKRKPGFAFA